MTERTGLVCGAGGARGAYEAGVLLELGPHLAARGEWPTVFTGASVGAINALSAAGMAHLSVDERAAEAPERWREVVKQNVFRPLPVQALRVVGRYLADVAGGQRGRLQSLLDPARLRSNLPRWIDFDALARNVREGRVHAAAAVASGLYSGRATAFWSGVATPPSDSAIRYVQTELRAEHAAAASAIPLLFPPIEVSGPGAGWYADGSTRLRDPLRPALELGATRLVVIGNAAFERPDGDTRGRPSLGDAAVAILEALAVDPLSDNVAQLAADGVPRIVVAPPQAGALGALASDILDRKYRRPRGALHEYRVLDRLLGGDTPLHGELMSYILFDRDFIDELLEMGRRDARAWVRRHPGMWVN